MREGAQQPLALPQGGRRLVQRNAVVEFHKLAALHLVDGKAHAGGVALGVKVDLAQRRVHEVVAQHFLELGRIRAAGLFNGGQQALGGGVGIVVAETGLAAEGLDVGLAGFLVLGQGAGVLGVGGVGAFAVLAGHFEEGFVLYAVGADKRHLEVVAAHLLDELGGHGLVAAEDQDVGLGAAQFAHHGRKVHGVGGHGFKQHGLHAGFFQNGAVVVGKALAVIAVVVQSIHLQE